MTDLTDQDHATAAVNLLTTAGYHRGPSTTGEIIAAAQVRATLALAEAVASTRPARLTQAELERNAEILRRESERDLRCTCPWVDTSHGPFRIGRYADCPIHLAPAQQPAEPG